MRKHWQKMVDAPDYPITRGTLEHYALQAALRTSARSEYYKHQKRKRALHLISLGVRTVIVTAVLFGALAGLALMLWGGR